MSHQVDFDFDILAHLDGVKRTDSTGNYTARCPFHDDQQQSFSIHPEKGYKCHAGDCGASGGILDLSTKLSNKAQSTRRGKTPGKTPGVSTKSTGKESPLEIVDTYAYNDENGALLFRVVRGLRDGKKTFFQQRPDPDKAGKWITGLGDIRRVLYHLDALTSAPANKTVYFVEGEKDADRLRGLGLLATCNPMGAGKWDDTYTEALKGRTVVILPDNDAAGINHARAVAAAVHPVATRVKFITGLLNDLPEKGDVSDWLDQGRTVDDLETVVERSPEWSPDDDPFWSDPWKIYTLADAYAERPPITYLVDGLFPLPSLSIVYGPPAALKSLLLMDLAACVVKGAPWLETPNSRPGNPKETAPGAALWLDLDNGSRRTHERIEAIGRAHGLTPDAPLFYVSMPSPWPDASDQDHMYDLRRRIILHDIKLVIIDNLGAIRGNVEENSAEMMRIMQPLRQLCEQTGTAIVIIHHQNKNAGSNRAGDRLRGHSCIEAALDLALCVGRDDRSSLVTIQSTKTRDIDVVPFGADFSYEHKDGTTELRRARFWGASIEDTGGTVTLDDAIFTILNEVKPDTMKQQDIIKAVHKMGLLIGRDTIRHRLEILGENKALRVEKGQFNSSMYSIIV